MEQTPELPDRLRARNWRMTPQRRAIAHALAGRDVHLTAEQVHERARSIVEEISLATVYNALRELVEMEEIAEISAGGATLFDANNQPHDHLVCTSCGELRDVYVSSMPTPALDEDHGYEISELAITFRGLCPKCAAE